MTLQGRNLQQGLTGTDVAAVQTALAQLSYTVPGTEQQASSFGTGTLSAVQRFQADHGLSPSGVVDADTASALTAVAVSSTYVVTGLVSSPVSAGATGLAVELVDKNVGGDVNLTSGKTSAQGVYSLSVVISPVSLRQRNKTHPDLQVRVSSGTNFLAASVVRYNAPLSLTLNVSLPADATGLASEYESLTASIGVLYKGQLSALQEGVERQDITFLANKSGWDARAVALAALADQFSQVTAPAPVPPAPATAAPVGAATSPTAPPTVSLAPEFYYALFRAGLPADANSLFRTPSQSVQAIWQQAIAQGVIPQALSSQLSTAVQSYQTLSAANLLAATPVVGVSTLGAMLTVSKLTAAQQTTFSQLSAQYGQDSNFWDLVSGSLGAPAAKQLQLDGQMFYLSLNNAPLVTALYAAEAKAPLTSPLDLVAKGYYDAAQWTPLIGNSTPAQIPGQSADNYAQFLAAQVRLSFPTAVAGDQVKRGIFPVSDTSAVAESVSTFLTTNYSEFTIGAESVEAFIARTKLTGVAPAVVTQVKRLQRVFQLTPDDQTMSVLLRHNLDSAYAITRYDSAAFLRAFGAKLGGADNASATYSRAQHIYSSVLNVALSYLSARRGPVLGGRATVMNSFPSAPANTPYPVVAYPTLDSLFGSLDYCTCQDCQSILSPAAYLVDLLHYLDQQSPTSGYQNPQAVLFQRRPDLQYLPLTCDNTNTALPYIDVVNETLEYYVANRLSLASFQGYSTDDTVTSADLLANPQFVNNAAYATLQGAFFPPPLPFNRSLGQLRLLFGNMNLALPDVMAALRTSTSGTISQTGSGYGVADVLIEQLGISRDEYRIFTDGTLQLPGLYGYPGPEAAALTTLQNISLQNFSQRTGVAYADVVSILKTQFVNPDAILIERLERLNVPFSTLQTLNSTPSTGAAFIAGLPAGLDARAYGGITNTDYGAVVQWVTNPANFARIASIITLSNPSNSADLCSGTSFAFRYLNGNPLTATDFVKLIRFIRLWQKLGVTIEQTDDILTALYPAAKMPTGNNDAVNLPLLDAGFTILLPRIGNLFQAMNLLSLTTAQFPGALLACWAPIATVGDNALYQQMFGGPTLQREDPGAPIATVGGGPNAGDKLVTIINSVPVSQTVAAGDTLATIATKTAAQINGTITTDPTTGLRLNQRIAASAQDAVITIRAGFTLSCAVSVGGTETFTAQSTSPVAQTATVGGSAITPGDILTATINTVEIQYVVQVGDTLAGIAVNIANAINSTTSPDPYSGLPLNSLLVASASGGVVSINSANSGAPLALTGSYVQGTTGTYAAGSQVPAYATATVGGTVATGDLLTTTINGVGIPCKVVAGQTTAAAVAASVATAINGTATPDPVSGMALNSILHAAANGAAITIAANDPATPLTITSTATGAMTYTSAGPFPAAQTATVAGTFATGGVLTTTINAVTLTHTVVAGETPTTIAAAIATAINTTSTADPLTNVSLNQLVSAAAAGGVVTVTSLSTTASFSLATSVLSGTYTAGLQPPPFADNGYGDFLADPTQTLFGHEPVLRAAFNLTGAEFTLITNSLQFNSSTPLTLNNISSIFRPGWLAHTLGLSVIEFLLLRQTTGLDPFAPLDPSPTEPVDAAVIRFIRLVQALSAAGLPPVQALYLLWNQDISGKSTPDVDTITGLAFALRAAFSAVAAQFTIQTDPDGTIAKSLMALVYGNTATDFYFGLLNNTLVSSIDYPNNNYPAPQPAPLQAVIDASGGSLGYDNLRKQLSFAGVLDAKTQATVDAAISANQNVPALHQALADLATANQQMVGPFFATYPELRPLYLAFASSTDPVQQKRTTLLANFLPSLIAKRNQEQALATVTASAGTDPSYANALLDDPTILHAAADATAPEVNDLTALNLPGLAAQIFFSNNLSGTPDIVLDADPVSYAPSTIGVQQTATVSGKVTAGDVLTTAINGVSVPYTVTAGQTAANVAAGIAAAIEAATTPDPFSGLPLNDVVTTSAQAGVLTVQAADAGAGVSVNCAVTPASAIPPTFTAGAAAPASQFATVGGAITVNDVLTTTINTIAIAYTVVASDTSPAILAAHIAAAINATASADPASGLPLNQVITAASNSGVVTITATVFGPDFTLGCSLSAAATETWTAGTQTKASQTATVSQVLPANDAVIATINSVAVQYTVTPTDTTLAGLAANVAAAVNSATTVDSVTGKALNTIVTASSAAGVITITTVPPGVPFTLACSLLTGAFTLGSQISAWQSAVVSGGIAAGDVLSTTINGITVNYSVTGGEGGIAVLAANVAAAVNGAPALSGLVSAGNVGGIVTFRSAGSSAFTLACTASTGASASYSTGPQFPAWQAIVSGGFSPGDLIVTNINDASVAYQIVATDATPSIIAAKIVAAVNTSTTVDPLTSLPVNGLVFASNVGATVTFRSAGPALVMSCSISAGATEVYAVSGELPARPGGAAIAGLWSGYLDAPQDGFYNIQIDTDPGAAVTLSLGGEAVTMTPSPSRSVWNNQGPVSLSAGQLVQVAISVTSLRSALTLNWQSAGLGWQTIPAGYLYSDTLVDRLQTAYVRFLKITSLAASLSLTADEIAYLGTSNGVNTTDGADKLAPGTVTFTPASMVNINPGSVLVIDSGPAQEIVTVKSSTPATFIAVTVNPHDGTATPFPIVALPEASTGNGWLNLLAVSPIAGSSTAALHPAATYAAGPQTPASQALTVGGTIKAGDTLTTTINGVSTAWLVTVGDTSMPILAAHIAAAIGANQSVSASSSGPVVTIAAAAFGPDFTLSTSLSAGAAETYISAPRSQAFQTATVSAVLPAGFTLVTILNSVSVQYTITAADTTAAIIAGNVAAAINATATVDTVTNRPLNGLVKASAAGGVITIATVSPGAFFTLTCSVAGFRQVLSDLLNFARIKAAVSPNDEQLLAVLENPAILSADGATPLLVKLTGWTASSLYSLLQHFFGNAQLSNISSVERLRKVFDTFGFVTTSSLPAGALLAATTNAPTPATVASLQSALRALYAASDWLNVIKPISDSMRILQRDALVAYILQQLGDRFTASLVTLKTTSDAPAGSTSLTFGSVAALQANMGVQGSAIPPNTTGSPAGATTVTLSGALSADVPSGSTIVFAPSASLSIATADDLFEFFLIDVETQPPVETSRIRLALSSVQLFIERVLRNLESQTLPTDIDGSLWTWMKRYRVWQANREVFLWPENWLYPELRDDPSPFFQQMMSALLQSDITDDAAESAYLDYLSSLELVAKLEPCGLYYVPGTSDSDETSYVVARTAGAHRKYYFRQLQYGSWTPWAEIQIDCEDMPLTPVVWNGRLLLFWLKIKKSTSFLDSPTPPPVKTSTLSSGNKTSDPVTKLSLNDLQQAGAVGAAEQVQGNVTVSAVLCWSEYYNGKWQPQKTSDINRPTTIGTFDASGPGAFDPARALLQLAPATVADEYYSLKYRETAPPASILANALVLGITWSPSVPVFMTPWFTGGFVLHNTHSLPVRWEDITLPLFQPDGTYTDSISLLNFALPPNPGRAVQPSSAGGEIIAGPPTLLNTLNITYWTLKAPGQVGPYSQINTSTTRIMGLSRAPRTIDSAASTADQNAPFFFEDRHNVFYVTTTQTQTLFHKAISYGLASAGLEIDAASAAIPRLVVSNPPPDAIDIQLSSGPVLSGADGAVVSRFVAVNGAINAALGSTAPVVYQGTTIFPAGQSSDPDEISATPPAAVKVSG